MIERAKQLARRKEIHEVEFPETRHGAVGRNHPKSSEIKQSGSLNFASKLEQSKTMSRKKDLEEQINLPHFKGGPPRPDVKPKSFAAATAEKLGVTPQTVAKMVSIGQKLTLPRRRCAATKRSAVSSDTRSPYVIAIVGYSFFDFARSPVSGV